MLQQQMLQQQQLQQQQQQMMQQLLMLQQQQLQQQGQEQEQPQPRQPKPQPQRQRQPRQPKPKPKPKPQRQRQQQSSKQAASRAVPQPMARGAAPAATGLRQKGAAKKRSPGHGHVQDKQSGVKGVSWVARSHIWAAAWRDGGILRRKVFAVRKYMRSSGKGYQEADAEALRDAIAFREGKAEDRVIQEGPRPDRKGVYWQRGRWVIRLCLNGKYRSGGSSRPRDGTPEEVERAYQAAAARKRQLEQEGAGDERETLKKRKSGAEGDSGLP